ncbi:hypothetical protein [Variovorax terrae]|uniref:Uncharacterized protein n=1 Tax=Variovorax terrae TaxID=2923278 RepID=A0A9X1VXK3_9BURK|nr:hypothetical protein [Variovorax terrae]MCJ0762383.1 hypothetical protein [Variovorax terrae]
MKTNTRNLLAAAGLALLAATAAQAQPYVNATVGGALAPGVYGRIDIGNAPPPPVYYPQPVIITHPPVMVPQQPVYLYVPPGHQKHWAKHCARYNACGQPVYFVKVDERRGKWRGREDEQGHGGHGRGHGRRGHDD